MRLLHPLPLSFFVVFLIACSGTRRTSDADTVERALRNSNGVNTVEVDAASSGIDLTSYLRRVAGVLVRGSGAEATIRVRNDTNMQGNTTPLFVIDGTPIGNDFSTVYSTIDINEISRVTVLKNVTETNRYGMQGASGVIEIRLKK